MASAKNWVVAGDYMHRAFVFSTFGKLVLMDGFKKVPIDKQNVASYKLITDEHQKSAASGVARGLVGGALLGPVGMIAGAASAKNKSIYNVAIQFTDGKRSLAELDKKRYDALVKSCF